ILGRLEAGAQVFLVNPNGIVFGPGAQVDVGALLASNMDIPNDNFVDGSYTFTGNGAASGIESQEGATLAAGGSSGGGYIVLLAPSVTNAGQVTAKPGTVAMGAGDQVTVRLLGGGRVELDIDQELAGALLINEASGELSADGGLVLLRGGSQGALN